MEKRGRKNKKNFTIKIISSVMFILIVLVFLIGYFNFDKISGRVVEIVDENEESISGGVNKAAAVKSVDWVSLSVATLKDSYEVKEKILLTDPPDENIISGNVVEDSLENSVNTGVTDNINSVGINSIKTNRVINRNENIALKGEKVKSKGYIIEFENKPLVLKEKELSPAGVAGITASAKTKLKTDINKERTKIRTKRETIKNNIKTKLGKKSIRTITGNAFVDSNPDELRVLGEYENVFNGIALDITNEEAEKVKTISGVKSVSPNLEVKALLMDSVPLIGADKVWELDADGNNCVQSGKECLTGKNVTIAIIDTGIDYTHADLGGSESAIPDFLERENGNVNTHPLFYIFDTLQISDSKIYFLDENKEIYRIMDDSVLKLKLNDSYNYHVFFIYGNKIVASIMTKKDFKFGLLEINFDNSQERFLMLPTDEFYINAERNNHYLSFYYAKNMNADFENEKKKLWVYDFLTGKLNYITDVNKSFESSVVNNEKVYYSFNEGKNSKIYVYNLINKNGDDEINIRKPNYLIDSYGDEILISMFEDNLWAVINTTTKYIKYISIPGTTNVNLAKNNKIVTPKGGGAAVSLNRFGVLNNNLMILEDQFLSKKFTVYDRKNKKEFSLYNLSIKLTDPQLEGNKICFSSEQGIYCFDYNLSNNYSIPFIPIFNPKVAGGYDFVNNDNDPMDDHGHGTHVAGIAAGSGAGGLKGIAPNAELYAYKVLNSKGSGSFARVIEAIERSVDPDQDGDFSDHLHIISMSLSADCGTYNKKCGPNDPLSKAIDNGVNAGVLAIIAAGNSGPGEGTIGSPGTARKAITVGATDKSDIIASFSSRGPVKWTDSQGNEQFLIKPDVVAPGVNICSAERDSAWNDRKCLDDKHVSISGTSMATPMVAGAVALLKQKNPDWNPEEIKQILKNTAVDLGYLENIQGAGRINLTTIIFSRSGLKFQCNNNIDDDSDSRIDYPADSGCLNYFDNNESNIILFRPQSKLSNSNFKTVTGTLRMYLQKKDKKGKWVNVKKAVDKKITIPGKGLVKLDNGKNSNDKQVFKGWNNLNVFAKAKGDYRVYTAFAVGNKKTIGSPEFKVV